MAPRRKVGDPTYDGAGLAFWPPIGCAHNLTIRIREALVDTAPHAWLVIEEPPSFTNPGGFEASAMVPLESIAVLSACLTSAGVHDTGWDWPTVDCAHDGTVEVGVRGDAVTVTVTGAAGGATVKLDDDAVAVLCQRLDWLSAHHYHLSNP